MNIEEIKAMLKEQREEAIELTSNERIISRGFIIPLIDSGPHLRGSRGTRTPPYEKRRGLSSITSSPLRRDDSCPSHCPIKPLIELGKSVINVTKRYLGKGVFKYKGTINPFGEAFRSLNPLLCKSLFLFSASNLECKLQFRAN